MWHTALLRYILKPCHPSILVLAMNVVHISPAGNELVVFSTTCEIKVVKSFCTCTELSNFKVCVHLNHRLIHSHSQYKSREHVGVWYSSNPYHLPIQSIFMPGSKYMRFAWSTMELA